MPAALALNPAYISRPSRSQVTLLADPRAECVKAMGLSVDATAVLGNVRSKRFSMVVKDNVVTELNVEPDNFGLTCTLSHNLLEKM